MMMRATTARAPVVVRGPRSSADDATQPRRRRLGGVRATDDATRLGLGRVVDAAAGAAPPASDQQRQQAADDHQRRDSAARDDHRQTDICNS